MWYQNENFGGEYVFRSNPHNGWEVPAHLHEYSEILYCREGQGEVLVNGRPVPVSEGQLVWIPPNYVHQYRFKNAFVVCAVFSNDWVPLFFRELADRQLLVKAIDESLRENIIMQLPQWKGGNVLWLGGYLNLIAADVMAQAEFLHAEPADGLLYQKVISYLSVHFAEEITLLSVARRLGYHEKYLSHSLHSLTGIHFRQLLNFYRIDRAKKMLRSEQDCRISDIALACGFSAMNTFHRAFREQTGLTPSEYKAWRDRDL